MDEPIDEPMNQIMNMSYEEFADRLLNDQLPKIENRKPLPNIVRETTGMYYSYPEWAYNNRELLKYVEAKDLYALSPYAMHDSTTSTR